MKRVRYYLAGAAVLAPAAAGMALPTAAQAMTTTGAAHQVKSVSLKHSGIATTAGCTGTTEFTITQNGHVRGHGWATRGGPNAGFGTESLCIGTVVVSMEYTKVIAKHATITVGNSAKSYHHNGPNITPVSGIGDVWYPTSFGIHEWFPFESGEGSPLNVYLNAGSTYNNGGAAHVFHP